MKPFAPDRILWQESLRGGEHWSGVLRRGLTLRLTDRSGGANVAALFYNQEERLERYNMADTLKAQHTAYLTAGHVCYSDMGRVLCSITGDTCGWHDPLGGVSNAAQVASRYGAAPYQQVRNEFHRNGYDSLLVELAKHGLGSRDLVANINFFSKLQIGLDGAMQFVADHSAPGSHVDLRFEMNVLVVLSTCQHALDPDSRYRPRPIDLIAWDSGPAGSDDPCRLSCAENTRGFHNTERLFL